MTSTPLPENWRSLLAGYVIDDLSPEEMAQVQAWLADDPAVAAELAALEVSWHAMPAGLVPQSPPPQLRDRVLSAVRSSPTANTPTATPVPSSPAPPRRSVRPWGLAWLGLGWAVTAAALVSVMAENQQLKQELLQSEAVVASFSQPDNHLYILTGAEAQPQASGRLVVNPEAATALIVTTDLPPLAAGQVYRLWAIVDQNPLFCGQFNPHTEQATSQWQLPDATCGSASGPMLITAESADAPPIPAGTLVLQTR